MGFGGAAARLFCREGAKVVLTDIRDEQGQRTANEPHRASEQTPEDDLLARILAHDPAPALTEQRREEMRRGWSELIAEYEAEHGAFTEEELAQARASLSPLD